MDFGTIFISLIAFSIAALVFPMYISESIQRDVDVLRDNLLRKHDIEELDARAGDLEQAKGQWDFLVRQELAHRLRWVRKQPHVLPIMGAIVVEVLIFSVAAHKVSRGGKTPGAIEDVVVALSFLLIGVSGYIAYQAIEGHRYFRRYLRAYEVYTALWRRNKATKQGQ